MRHNFLAVICLLVLTMPAAADDLGDGLNAYDAERYDEAVALLTPLAKAGTVEAQLALANVYNFGFGVPMDQTVALHWLIEAGEQGNRDALYNAGVMTLRGVGTQPDPEQGLNFLHRAAELESAEAFYELGMISLIEDAPKTGEVDTGLGYLARAGQLGDRRASAMLGVLLQDLPEVEHSLVKSALHFQVAIARGCDDVGEDAAHALARLSPEERASYEYNLPATLVLSELDAAGRSQAKGHCFP